MPLAFRPMTPADLPEAFAVRLATVENSVTMQKLEEEYSITPASMRAAMEADVSGWVCHDRQALVGFAMGDSSTGEVVVLAVRPEYVGQGIGKQLLALVRDWLFSTGHRRIWLRSNPDATTRAFSFYRRLGWRPSGEMQDGEEILVTSKPMAFDDLAGVAEQVQPGARLCGTRRLKGGVSANVHALELEGTDGLRRTVVVRHHGGAEWKDRPGHVAAMEYGLLQAAHRNELPVPEPLLLDTSGNLFPEPFLVMEFVDGSTDVPAGELDACLEIMATTLVRLHEVPTEGLPELPSRIDPLPELFDYLPELDEWRSLRQHLEGCTDSAYQGRPVLLHGDFWPGNLVWREGRLIAILDWEDAALGDPAADVAGCRLELLWKHGPAAVERFTRSYARERPLDVRRLALWEVYVASAAALFMGAWGLEPEREAEMRSQAHAFVREAGSRLLSTA